MEIPCDLSWSVYTPHVRHLEDQVVDGITASQFRFELAFRIDARNRICLDVIVQLTVTFDLRSLRFAGRVNY